MILFLSFPLFSSLVLAINEHQSYETRKYHDFERFGNWIESSELDGLVTDVEGSFLRLQFEGSHLQVLGKLLSEDSIVSINIDGINCIVKKAYIMNNDADQILFSKNLAGISHNIEIKLVVGKLLATGLRLNKYIRHKEDPELQVAIDQKHTIHFYNMQSTGVWTDATEESTSGNTGVTYKEFTFVGTKLFVYAKVASGYGNLVINLDGVDVKTVDTNQTPANNKKMVYESEELIYKEHTVKLSRGTNKIGIAYCEYIGHAPYSLYTQANFLENANFNPWRTDWHGIGSNNLNAYIKFNGFCQRVVVYGRIDSGNGNVKITYDGVDNIVNTNGATKTKQVLFDSGYVLYKSHSIKISPVTKFAQINGILFYNNTDSGIISIEAERREIYSGSSLYLRLKRTADHLGNCSLRLITESNKDSTFFKPLDISVLFEEGDLDKFIKLETNFVNTETLNYTIKCIMIDPEEKISFENTQTTVNVMCFNIPTELKTINYNEFTKSANWVDDSSGNSGTAGAGETATATFTGSFLSIYGKAGPSFGQMKITIDSLSDTINTHDYVESDVILYVFPYLLYGEHQITIECISEQIGLNYMTYYNAPQYGTLKFDQSEYEIHKGTSFLLKINRFDGLTGRVSCKISIKNINVPGNSNILIDDLNNHGPGVYPTREVSFEEDITYQEVRIYTFDQFESESAAKYTFKIELIDPAGGAAISSSVNVTTVTIIDNAYPSEEIYEVPFLDMEEKSGWNNQIEENGGGWTGKENAYKEMSFQGVRAFVYGFIAFDHGDIDISIDGTFVATINTTGKTRKVRYLLYVSPVLDYRKHTIRATRKVGNVGLCFFRYQDTAENGLFNIVQREVVIEKNGTAIIDVIRTKGSKGSITIRVEPVGGNATTNHRNEFQQNIAFGNGVTKKQFNVFGKILFNANSGNNYTVKAKLVSFSGGTDGTIGRDSEVDITIIDPIYPLDNLVQIPFKKLTNNNVWTYEPANYGGYVYGQGKFIEATFRGVKGFLYGYISNNNHGDCFIYLDGKEVLHLNTFYSISRVIPTLFYTTPDLTYGDHTIKVVAGSNGLIGINFVNYLTGFFPTEKFSLTDDFVQSKSFSISNDFDKSHDFTSSDPYSKTPEFSLSNDFTISNQMTRSGVFDQTNSFSLSSGFKTSSQFSCSTVFSVTKDFLGTVGLSFSDIFSVSKEFGQSDAFSYSKVFEQSHLFSISNKYYQSGLFSYSKEFGQSDIFSVSKVFDQSGAFSYSKVFGQSDIFSISNEYYQSGAFSYSKVFDQSSVFSLTLKPTIEETSVKHSLIDFDSSKMDRLSSEYGKIDHSSENQHVSSITLDVYASSSLKHEMEESSDKEEMTSVVLDHYSSINHDDTTTNIPNQYTSEITPTNIKEVYSSVLMDETTTINQEMHKSESSTTTINDNYDTSINKEQRTDATSITSTSTEEKAISSFNSEQAHHISSKFVDVIDSKSYLSQTGEKIENQKSSIDKADEFTSYQFIDEGGKEASSQTSSFLETSSRKLTDELEDKQNSIYSKEISSQPQDNQEISSFYDEKISIHSSVSIVTSSYYLYNEESLTSNSNDSKGMQYSHQITSIFNTITKVNDNYLSSTTSNEEDIKTTNNNQKDQTTVAHPTNVIDFESKKISIISLGIETTNKKDGTDTVLPTYDVVIDKSYSSMSEFSDNIVDKKLNGGQIAGIIIGVLIILIIIIILIYYFVIRRKQENVSYSDSFDELPENETNTGNITAEITITEPELEEWGEEVQSDDFPSSTDYDEMPNELIGNA